MRDLGRIDYKSRTHQFAAIWYSGKKDQVIGSFPTKQEAADCLQAKIRSTRRAK